MEITEAAPSPQPESPPSQTSKPIPQTLEEEKELLEASLSRCELAPVLLDNYVKQLDLNKFSIKSLDDVLEAFDQQSHKWDKKIQELKKNIRDVENKIEGVQPPTEDVTPAQAEGPLSSNHRVQFSLEANSTVVVELRLAYCGFSRLLPFLLLNHSPRCNGSFLDRRIRRHCHIRSL